MRLLLKWLIKSKITVIFLSDKNRFKEETIEGRLKYRLSVVNKGLGTKK